MTGRIAVVTGATGGIGRAVATRLRDDGHRLVVAGRDPEGAAATARDLGADDVRVFDVADEAAVAAALGDLDVHVLVNNAGVAHAAPLERTAREDWDRLLAVNATGAFLCTRAVLPSMRARDTGRIVTIASTAGLVGSPYTAAYSASKHAAVGLMRAVAAEVAGTGVTANAVCPTFVDSPMTDRSVDAIVAATGRDAAAARAALESRSPLGRLVRPDEVAAAVAYLVSDDAAAVNGQTIVLDGGGVQQ